MKIKSVSSTILAITGFIVLVGCDNMPFNNVKFNKSEWDSIGDMHSYPNRENMLEDLIENHKIKGLNYHQLIDSLGQPQNHGDTKDSIYYEIVVNYGYLDPKSGKYLSIGLNKDSIATGFKIVEWSNRHRNE